MEAVIKEIVSIEVPDGLIFDEDSIALSGITEGADYQGTRIKVICYLGQMKTVLKLDIGFGDSVFPSPIQMSYPEILGDQGFNIFCYSLESVIAEKFEAMIVLDAANSRMKDFYDIYQILENNDISDDLMSGAIRQTFKTRQTELPSDPAIFNNGFCNSSRNNKMWSAFIKRMKGEPILFSDVMRVIKNRLEPIYRSLELL